MVELKLLDCNHFSVRATQVLLIIYLCFQISKTLVVLTLPGQKNRWLSLNIFLLILTSAPTIFPFPSLTSLSSTLGSRMLQSPIQQSATYDLIPNMLYDPILITFDYILLLFFTKIIAFSSMILQSPNTIYLFLSQHMIEQEGLMMHPSPKLTFPTISFRPRFNVLAPPFFIGYLINNQNKVLNVDHIDRVHCFFIINIIQNQRQQQQRMIEHIKKLFLVIIGLTCFTCFQRADYNLPLFAFSYFLWDYNSPNSQKSRLFYLFISTWVVDFIWLIYWGVTWSSNEYQNSGQSGSSTFVMALSIITFIVKLGVIIILFLMEPECKLAIKNFVPNAKYIISPTPAVQATPY